MGNSHLWRSLKEELSILVPKSTNTCTIAQEKGMSSASNEKYFSAHVFPNPSQGLVRRSLSTDRIQRRRQTNDDEQSACDCNLGSTLSQDGPNDSRPDTAVWASLLQTP
eukprot:705120-Pelagomonas_calceolata.AAC.2